MSSVEVITIDQLEEQTEAANADYLIIGGTDARKISVENLLQPVNDNINGSQNIVWTLTGGNSGMADAIYDKWAEIPSSVASGSPSYGVIYINNGATILTGTYTKYDHYTGSITLTDAAGNVYVWVIQNGVHSMERITDKLNMMVKKDTGSTAQTMTSLLAGLTEGSIYLTCTELVSDKPAGKYGTILINKYNSSRAAAICLCTDGTMYVNSWNASTSAATGWMEK